MFIVINKTARLYEALQSFVFVYLVSELSQDEQIKQSY